MPFRSKNVLKQFDLLVRIFERIIYGIEVSKVTKNNDYKRMSRKQLGRFFKKLHF